MLQHATCCDACRWVDSQHFSHQILGGLADTGPLSVRERDPAPHDHLEKPLHVVVVKRRVAAQHDVQHDAHRPDVARTAVAFLLEDLGRHVLRRATRGTHGLILIAVQLREAEVSQLDELTVDVHVLLQHNILRLDVPVSDALLVQKSQGIARAVDHSSGELFGEFALAIRIIHSVDDSVEQIAAIHELHHHRHGIGRDVDLVQPRDVWVLPMLEQQLALLFGRLHVRLAAQLLLRDDLNRAHLMRLLVLRQLHLLRPNTSPFHTTALDTTGEESRQTERQRDTEA